MVDEPVDGGDSGYLVGEYSVPCSEGLVGGDQQRAVFVAHRDQLEEDAGFGLVLPEAGFLVAGQVLAPG